MFNELFQKLKNWRNDYALKEKIEPYKIFSNETLKEIAFKKPKSKEDLLKIKGITENKIKKYAIDIITLINDFERENENKKNKIFSVSEYLTFLNEKFLNFKAFVKGEVTSLEHRNKYLIFNLKDKSNNILQCFVWQKDFELFGKFEIGREIIVCGIPEIYPLTGNFRFKISSFELVGEGILKKAYDELKAKLEKEGLFSSVRKKSIPSFPEKIGLITSKAGAVIHDFENNLGKFGFQIKFIDSRVEGNHALKELMAAIDYFEKNKNVDVIVIIRGGGSLESLQVFNNETLVRKIAGCKIPIICGIGHEKDVPLASLVADKAVSTPTAAAVLLSKDWENAKIKINDFEKYLLLTYEKFLFKIGRKIDYFYVKLKERIDRTFKIILIFRNKFNRILSFLDSKIFEKNKEINQYQNLILKNFQENFEEIFEDLKIYQKRIENFNPEKFLKLGYSIIFFNGKILKSVDKINKGDLIDIHVSDGKIKSEVKDKEKNKNIN